LSSSSCLSQYSLPGLPIKESHLFSGRVWGQKKPGGWLPSYMPFHAYAYISTARDAQAGIIYLAASLTCGTFHTPELDLGGKNNPSNTGDWLTERLWTFGLLYGPP
jgi:hypothetical protein